MNECRTNLNHKILKEALATFNIDNLNVPKQTIYEAIIKFYKKPYNNERRLEKKNDR